MTDEELLIWLRVEDTNLTDFAADRIEALIKERDAFEAKLAKAVEVLSFASNVDTADWSEALDVRNQARATLAEIKG